VKGLDRYFHSGSISVKNSCYLYTSWWCLKSHDWDICNVTHYRRESSTHTNIRAILSRPSTTSQRESENMDQWRFGASWFCLGHVTHVVCLREDQWIRTCISMLWAWHTSIHCAITGYNMRTLCFNRTARLATLQIPLTIE